MPQNLTNGASFAFENIADLADWVIQRLLKDVDSQDLAIALKASDEAIKARIYKNLSTRAANLLQYEVDLVGPTQMRDVDKAKQQIVDVVLTLEKGGQIVVPRGETRRPSGTAL
jgi:flagellar motor switch protein FliG